MYHGVLAPNAPWRRAVVARDGEESPVAAAGAGACSMPAGTLEANDAKPGRERPQYRAWADLMRRAFETDVLACPRCSGRMVVLATIEDPLLIQHSHASRAVDWSGGAAAGSGATGRRGSAGIGPTRQPVAPSGPPKQDHPSGPPAPARPGLTPGSHSTLRSKGRVWALCAPRKPGQGASPDYPDYRPAPPHRHPRARWTRIAMTASNTEPRSFPYWTATDVNLGWASRGSLARVREGLLPHQPSVVERPSCARLGR
jgi:hypothetical protein